MNRTLTLVKTAYLKDQLETFGAAQIALAGRSNVGKSSLINRLAGRKALAKVSSTPGKTRSVNYYEVQPDGFFLVDLPGYGYARTSKSERAQWAKLIEKFLVGNPNLAGVAVLLDSRLPPQKIDIEMISFLAKAGIPMLPVLTKSDKPKQGERTKRQKEWQELLHLGFTPLCVSSKTGMGINSLWELLAEATADIIPVQPEPSDPEDAE